MNKRIKRLITHEINVIANYASKYNFHLALVLQAEFLEAKSCVLTELIS